MNIQFGPSKRNQLRPTRGKSSASKIGATRPLTPLLGSSLQGDASTDPGTDSLQFLGETDQQRYLNYSPDWDERFHATDPWLERLIQSKLWVKRQLPWSSLYYKKEHAALSLGLSELEKEDWVGKSKQLLQNTHHLQQQVDLSEDAWWTVSLQLKQWMAQSQKKPASDSSDSLKAQAFFDQFLQLWEQIPSADLQAFTMTAMFKGFEGQAAPDWASLSESEQAIWQTMIAYLFHDVSLKLVDNASLQNLRLLLQSEQAGQNKEGALVLSYQEAARFLDLCRELHTERRNGLAKLNLPMVEYLEKDESNNRLLPIALLPEELKLSVIERITYLQKQNQGAIRANLAFLRLPLTSESILKTEALNRLYQYLSERPNGVVCASLLRFIRVINPSETNVQRFLGLAEHPGFHHFRLVLASRLSQLCIPYPHLSTQLHTSLSRYGVGHQAGFHYLPQDTVGLKCRLDQVIFGFDDFKLSVIKQLDSKQSDATYVPCFILVGYIHPDSNTLLNKLSVELNTTLFLQEHLPQTELFEGRSACFPLFNRLQISLKQLMKRSDLTYLKVQLNQWMLEAHEQSHQMPTRPFILEFSELEAFSRSDWDEYEAQPVQQIRSEQAHYIVQVIRELKYHQRYINPFSGEEYNFSRLQLWMTYASEWEGWDQPIHSSEPMDSNDPYADFDLLEEEIDALPNPWQSLEGHVFWEWDRQLSDLDEQPPIFSVESLIPVPSLDKAVLQDWVDYYLKRHAALLSSSQLVALDIQPNLIQHLLRLIAVRQLHLEASIQFIYETVLSKLEGLQCPYQGPHRLELRLNESLPMATLMASPSLDQWIKHRWIPEAEASQSVVTISTTEDTNSLRKKPQGAAKLEADSKGSQSNPFQSSLDNSMFRLEP